VRNPFVQSVENLACRTDLYTIEGADDPLMIDRAWSRVEQGLTAGIDALAQLPAVRLDAWLWTGVLVPFVTQLFVRDPDWHLRLELRLANAGLAGINNTFGSVNQGRVLENQRVSSAVLRAEWNVLRPLGNSRFVTNDRGFSPMHHIIKLADGYVVPLKSDLALAVLATEHRQRLVWDGNWFIQGVDTVDLDPDAVGSLNAAMWTAADREIYGDSKPLVARASGKSTRSPLWMRLAASDGANLLGGTSKTRREYEYMHLDVCEFIRTPPEGSVVSLRVEEVPAVPWRSGDRRASSSAS